jgi:hypothetical protein
MGVIGAGLAGKPQYVLHPLRAATRARRLLPGGRPRAGLMTAALPWGLWLTVSELDAIGYSIRVGRVFDPCVTETLHRLIDFGDVVADVGANIGYLTSLAAVRAGPAGRVHAFEPQPQVLSLLQARPLRSFWPREDPRGPQVPGQHGPGADSADGRRTGVRRWGEGRWRAG